MRIRFCLILMIMMMMRLLLVLLLLPLVMPSVKPFVLFKVFKVVLPMLMIVPGKVVCLSGIVLCKRGQERPVQLTLHDGEHCQCYQGGNQQY